MDTRRDPRSRLENRIERDEAGGIGHGGEDTRGPIVQEAPAADYLRSCASNDILAT